VLSAYKEDPGTLPARDPNSTQDVTHSDEEWATLLQFREIWVMERIATPGLPQGWTDNGTTLACPDGEAVLGFRAHILPLLLAGKWDADDYILGKQFYSPVLEYSNPDLGPGDQLVTRKHLLGYAHNPSGAVAHLKEQVIEEYVGTELAYLRQVYAKLYAREQQAEQLLAQA